MYSFSYSVRKRRVGWSLSIVISTILTGIIIWYVNTNNVNFCVGEIECLVSLKIDGNGIFTVFGIAFAYLFVRKQLSQGEEQNTQMIQEARFSNITAHIEGAAENLLFCKSNEGFLHEKIDSVQYIIAWRVDLIENSKDECSYRFHFLFKIFVGGETYNDIVHKLCDKYNVDRWDYQILIPKIGNRYGAMTGVSSVGALDQMSSQMFQHLKRSMKQIQLLDCIRSETQKDVLYDMLKEANNDLLDRGVFEGCKSEY